MCEEFTYPHMIESFVIPRGFKVQGISTDDQGIIPEALNKMLEARRAHGGEGPRLLYTVPVGQNPTGGCLTLREQLPPPPVPRFPPFAPSILPCLLQQVGRREGDRGGAWERVARGQNARRRQVRVNPPPLLSPSPAYSLPSKFSPSLRPLLHLGSCSLPTPPPPPSPGSGFLLPAGPPFPSPTQAPISKRPPICNTPVREQDSLVEPCGIQIPQNLPTT